MAVAANNVIGAENDMPWRLSSDLKKFKATTMGKPVIMGRKTFESIGKPLPGRLNIVISRSTPEDGRGATWVSTISEALEIARTYVEREGIDEIMVIGGGNIYAQTIDQAYRLYVTHIPLSPEGDTRFPEISPKTWNIVNEEVIPKGERDDVETRFCIYEKRSN